MRTLPRLLPGTPSTLPHKRPTLLLRCILLFVACVAFNAVLWIISAICFTHQAKGDPLRSASRLLSLCLLAWTLGLRHALDADHISIIDNATRRIASLPRDPARPELGLRRPTTCGLFFSLGHSTIVVSVLIAVAVSTSVVNRLGGVSQVGGIIGASVSGSFLFLFGVINSVLLWKSWRASGRLRSQAATSGEKQDVAATIEPFETPLDDDKAELAKQTASNCPLKAGSKDPVEFDGDKNAVPGKLTSGQDIETDTTLGEKSHHFRGIFTRMAQPLLRMVDRPYKLYPIGILFGFGFDTASSIALLGVAAATNTTIIQEDGELIDGFASTGKRTSNASIVLLSLLFTAGMVLVDSCNAILMINAYAPGELHTRNSQGRQRWALFEERQPSRSAIEEGVEASELVGALPGDTQVIPRVASASTNLSHLLTLVSIILAFAISAIQILGLIGENCARCTRAADLEDKSGSGGLEGRWWLFWRRCNDQSGLIGAGIVGAFAVALLSWHAFRALRRRVDRR